jgi:hypothetical protein
MKHRTINKVMHYYCLFIHEAAVYGMPNNFEVGGRLIMALPIGARTNINEEVARLKRGVIRVLVYAGLSDALILWGFAFLINDGIVSFFQNYVALTYLTCGIGLIGTYLISQYRGRQAAHAEAARRLFWCFVVFVLALVIWQRLGIPVPINGISDAQANQGVLFQITFIMLGLILLGIWIGWFVFSLGLIVSAAVLIDYLAAAWIFISTALLLTSLALLAAGAWMRLSARAINADPFNVTR